MRHRVIAGRELGRAHADGNEVCRLAGLDRAGRGRDAEGLPSGERRGAQRRVRRQRLGVARYRLGEQRGGAHLLEQGEPVVARRAVGAEGDVDLRLQQRCHRREAARAPGRAGPGRGGRGGGGGRGYRRWIGRRWRGKSVGEAEEAEGAPGRSRLAARWIAAARDASSAASGKKYMSLKQVIPPRSISAQARSVPSRTKSRDTCRVSAGQTCSCSQRMSGRSSASPRISVMAACVWALTRPGIRTWPARSTGWCSRNRARASGVGAIASIRPSRIATAWASSTLPAGSTGTTQRGRRSEPLAMKKGPGSAGASRASIVARL